MNDDRENHPSFLKMAGLVAASVSITILVFFGSATRWDASSSEVCLGLSHREMGQ